MLVFQKAALKETFDLLKNFGFKNEIEVVSAGTNAKMNEIQALMGIQVLSYFQEIKEKQKRIAELYRSRLQEVPGIHLPPPPSPEVDNNYGYLPIELKREKFGMTRDELYKRLKEWNVFARRYFYPLICDYLYYRHFPVKDPLAVARRVADRILTLPIYDSLELSDVETICDIIRDLHSMGEKGRVGN